MNAIYYDAQTIWDALPSSWCTALDVALGLCGQAPCECSGASTYFAEMAADGGIYLGTFEGGLLVVRWRDVCDWGPTPPRRM